MRLDVRLPVQDAAALGFRTHARPARRLRSAKSKREARNSFLFGAVDVISSRMIAQKKVAPVTSDALVPVKDALIRAAMPDNLKIGDPIKADESRPQDWLAGMLSAEHIPLSTPVTGEAYGAIA